VGDDKRGGGGCFAAADGTGAFDVIGDVRTVPSRPKTCYPLGPGQTAEPGKADHPLLGYLREKRTSESSPPGLG